MRVCEFYLLTYLLTYILFVIRNCPLRGAFQVNHRAIRSNSSQNDFNSSTIIRPRLSETTHARTAIQLSKRGIKMTLLVLE